MNRKSTSNKIHVTLERAVCPACGKEYDTGALLLDKRLRQVFDMYTTTGFAPCPECAKLLETHVVLVEVSNSPKSAGNTMKQEEAYRTGNLTWMKREVAKKVFNMPIPENGIVFCPPEVTQWIKDHTEK